ncbi:MAG TPA: hypothetical protein VGW57_09340 [Chthoniobacterales bacterium]|nr:hypothetical protein [Chthoniobacterales bacterium]
MPKKRPFTRSAHDHLTALGKEARTALLKFRWATADYFSQYETLPHRSQRIVEEFTEVFEDLKRITPK